MNNVVLKTQAVLGEVSQNFSVKPFNKFTEEVNYDYAKTYRVNCYAILVITSGLSQYVVDFKDLIVSEGDVILISPGQVFHCVTPRRVEGYLISFSEFFFINSSHSECFKANLDILNNLSQIMHLSISEDRQEVIYSLIRLLKTNDVNTSEEKSTIIRQHLLSVLLHTLSLESCHVIAKEVLSSDRKLAMKFKMMVQKRISIKYNVEYFCNELNVSKSTLQKATRNAFQLSPKDIIQDVLLLEAQRLLFISKNRVQEIAYSLGFTDPTNFTKFFKKSVGITPDTFRKQQYRL